jgi:GT2 family glycosyltransferase
MEKDCIFIILVNYNGWLDTIECIESLLKLNYPNYRIVVVDNNSTDSSLTHIRNWSQGLVDPYLTADNSLKSLVFPLHPKPLPLHMMEDDHLEGKVEKGAVTLIKSTKNLGFAGGNNLGIKLALNNQAAYIWLLNNDTVVRPDALSHLVQTFSRYKKGQAAKLGMLGGKLRYYHQPEMLQAVMGVYKPFFGATAHIGQNELDQGQFDHIAIQENYYIVGACLFLSRDFIHEVGPMAEDYFLYYEEIDWVNRARKSNYEIAVCPEAVIYHKEGASVGNKVNGVKSKVSDYFSIANRLKITKRYYKKYLIPVYFSLSFILINRIRRRQFSRIPMILKIFIESLKS